MATPYDWQMMPKMSPTQYLISIMNRLNCSEKVVVIAFLYMERYFAKMNVSMGRGNAVYAHSSKNSYL